MYQPAETQRLAKIAQSELNHWPATCLSLHKIFQPELNLLANNTWRPWTKKNRLWPHVSPAPFVAPADAQQLQANTSKYTQKRQQQPSSCLLSSLKPKVKARSHKPMWNPCFQSWPPVSHHLTQCSHDQEFEQMFKSYGLKCAFSI